MRSLVSNEMKITMDKLKNLYLRSKILYKNESISKEIRDNNYIQWQTEQIKYDMRINDMVKMINDNSINLDTININIQQANRLLSNSIYYSPCNGYIIYLSRVGNIEPENDLFLKTELQKSSYLVSGMLVFYIIPDVKLKAEIIIDENKIYDVSIGNKVLLYFSSLPYQKFKVFNGTLVNISKSAKKGKFIGKVKLDEKDLQKTLVRGELLNFDVFFINASLNAKIEGRKKSIFKKIFSLP